jgi:hypothetical protein
MVMITVMLIMLTVAAQSWTFRIRRDMEKELIFRGEQYVNGLNLFRKKHGGGFPLGNLEVLVNKGPDGARLMRKLYKNPFDEDGEWQYLFLHPGGSGFINPCANAAAAMATFAAGGALPGQVPVAGGPVAQGIPGQGGRYRPGSQKTAQSGMGGLSAMDPKLFKETGIGGMNLPIVGVVNCEQAESISTYKGQTWLANWAFTPLAQGEFGGRARNRAIGGGKVGVSSGLGMSGAETYRPSDVQGRSGFGPELDADNRTDPRRNNINWGGRAVKRGGRDDQEEERDRYQWQRDREASNEEDDWEEDDGEWDDGEDESEDGDDDWEEGEEDEEDDDWEEGEEDGEDEEDDGTSAPRP